MASSSQRNSARALQRSIKKKNPELRTVINRRDAEDMNRTSSNIRGVLDNLRTQLQVLDDEIRADELSKMEYETHLANLQREKEELEERIRSNEEWIEQYDRDVGPFASKYEDMTAEIGQIYESAKKGHARGVQLLIDEFNYHPAYRRPGDTFTAIPFRPK